MAKLLDTSAHSRLGAALMEDEEYREEYEQSRASVSRPRDAASAPPAAVRREYVTALTCGHGRPTVSNYPPTTGSITRCATCGRWVGVIVYSKERK